jgi:hypothetical protein
MTTGGDRVLLADPAMISIAPGATGTARFVLTSGGVAIAGQQVNFSFVDDPSTPDDDPSGATLAKSSAVTDVSGAAAVGVHTGTPTTLKIRATAGSTQAEPLKIVVAQGVGSVVVAPFFAASSNLGEDPTSLDVRIFDAQPCAELLLANPPIPPLGFHTLPGSGGTTRFDLVTTEAPHAIVGRALSSHGNTIAVGCVDLAGSSLVTDGVVEVWLPLHDFVPDPVGTYALKSTLAFQAPLAAAAAISGPWQDLGDCPLDPAQLLLDCAIDALSPATAADPHDCRPNPAAGGEGPLGDAFAARRGVPIVDGAGTPTTCRGAVDASGAPSLDAIAMGLFGTPTPPLIVALPAIGDEAAHILDSPSLRSTLTVNPVGLPDQYLVTHTLVSAQFLLSMPSKPERTTEVQLAPLGLPTLTAYTTATTRDGVLAIDSHGFSLRLGRAARVGFGAITLAPRGVPPTAGGLVPTAGDLVGTLATLARSADGTEPGCATFDRALCAAVGSSPGCLATACPAGLVALTVMLDGSFDAADGTGLDFYLSGSTPLVDRHNDGTASQLGTDLNRPSITPSWSVDLRTAAGRARGTASLDGVRSQP